MLTKDHTLRKCGSLINDLVVLMTEARSNSIPHICNLSIVAIESQAIRRNKLSSKCGPWEEQFRSHILVATR
jgi:hypothetical protein